MSPPSVPDAAAATPEDPTLEEVAMFYVTTFIGNVASATTELAQHNATTLEQSLDAALHGDYTAGRLAHDTALLWAGGVRFATRLFSVGAPAEPIVHRVDQGPA